MQNVNENVVNDVATRGKYVTPEIEVIPLDVEVLLLATSGLDSLKGVQWGDDDDAD